jgi:hypothetical protein
VVAGLGKLLSFLGEYFVGARDWIEDVRISVEK